MKYGSDHTYVSCCVLFCQAILLHEDVKVRVVTEEFQIIITKGYEEFPIPFPVSLHMVCGELGHDITESLVRDLPE